MYSEPGNNYVEGFFDVLTERKGSGYSVLFKRSYSNFNLTYLGEDKSKTLQYSPTPHKIFISNKGGSDQNIDFSV